MVARYKIKTLTEFVIERQSEYPQAKGSLTRLLNDIGTAAKIVNREINAAGLVDILGSVGTNNFQGETQKKLDIFANEMFITMLKGGGECCAIASEENEKVVSFQNEFSEHGKYVVALDPLDGSSNIEANVSIGTLFSIYLRRSEGSGGKLEDLCNRAINKLLQATSFMARQPCWSIPQVKESTGLPSTPLWGFSAFRILICTLVLRAIFIR